MLLKESEYSDQGAVFHGLLPDIFGSKLDLMMVGLPREDADKIWSGFCSRCEEAAGILNGDDPESELGRFNAGKMLAHTAVSDTLGDAVDLCKEYRFLTEGLFDPALGKMVMVDHDEEDGSLSLYGVKLQMGSFARGWILRECRRILLEGGAECAFVNYGNFGFIAVGHHPYGKAWKVGLTNPFTRMPLEEVALEDCTMALSCNAPGAVGHVVHPSTGRPCEDRRMVAVISENAFDAKVLSTSLMLASPGEAEKIRENFPGVETRMYNL